MMKKKRGYNNNSNNDTVGYNDFESTDVVENASSGLGLPFEEAKALAADQLNGVEEIDLSGKMAILPGDLQLPEVSVGHLLNARLFYYLPAAEGILLAYRDLKVTCRLAATFCDRPFVHVVYSAKAVVFRPRIGQRLRGVVSQLSSIKRHATCILCGVLNVIIPLDERPHSDSNNQQSPLRVDDVICFELTSFTMAPNGTVSLVGRMCDVKELTNAISGNHKTVMPLQSRSSLPAVKSSHATIISSSAAVKSQPQTPTWLNPTVQQRQSAQHICFDSSSDDDDDDDSSSKSEGSFSEGFDEEDDKVISPKALKPSPSTPASSSTTPKEKQHPTSHENTQNGCTTPTQIVRQVQSSNMEDESDDVAAAKLEPMTPSRHSTGFIFDLNGNNKPASIQRQLNQQQQQRKSAKKRKYLAD